MGGLDLRFAPRGEGVVEMNMNVQYITWSGSFT